jgi:hypothetical protein
MHLKTLEKKRLTNKEMFLILHRNHPERHQQVATAVQAMVEMGVRRAEERNSLFD